MSDYPYQIVKRNDVVCLHIMVEISPVNDGVAHAYIPLDDIAGSAMSQGFAIYAMPDAMLQKICESQGYTKHSLPAQQILAIAQSALITGRTWHEVDRMHNLIEALEDIAKLCQEQLEKGKEEGSDE